MSMTRCPQCQAPMTSAEAGAGRCPMCDAVIAPAAKSAPQEQPMPSAQPPSTVRAIVLAVMGSFLFCVLPVGMMFYFGLPDPPKEPEKKDPQIAKAKDAAPKLPKVEPKPNPTDEAKAKKDSLADGKDGKDGVDVEPKKLPEKKPHVEPKKDDTKTENPKKEVPKKEEVKPPPKVEPEKPKVEPKKVEPAIVNAKIMRLVANDAIRIDGDLGDWKDIEPALLHPVERGRPTKPVVHRPKSQKAYFAYSVNGVYIAVDVVDTSGVLENSGKPDKGMWAFWDCDAVEVFIDTAGARPRERGDPSSHQFFALPFATSKEPGVGGYESRILRNKAGRTDWTIVAFPDTVVQRAAKKTADGWAMELFIPKSCLREPDLKAGKTIGFEMQLDSGTNLYYFWACQDPLVQVSTHPQRWGELLLAGTDGTMEVLDANHQPIKAFSPGQTLHIRVTDRDASPGKLDVVVRTKSGARLAIALQEKVVGSGVFAADLPTRLKARQPSDPPFLDVETNDVITIEYVDAIRANGERKVPVCAEVRLP